MADWHSYPRCSEWADEICLEDFVKPQYFWTSLVVEQGGCLSVRGACRMNALPIDHNVPTNRRNIAENAWAPLEMRNNQED